MMPPLEEKRKTTDLTEFLREYLEFSEKEKRKTDSQSISGLRGKNNAQHNAAYQTAYIQAPKHRFLIDEGFIERCNDILQDEYQYLKSRSLEMQKSWRERNKNKFKEYIKKYLNSEKGNIARKRRDCIRHIRFKRMVTELTKEEIEEIRKFYTACPDGYEVDHIVPISKGGNHHISNLQYLTKIENRIKGAKLEGEEEIKNKKLKKLNFHEMINSILGIANES